MLNLTFGEQIKLVLRRKNMTIKELAELIEEKTGKKMSRQNLTQRLGRDNFQEQDMRMIAGILECPFQLNILEEYADEMEQSGTGQIEMRIQENGELMLEDKEDSAEATEELTEESAAEESAEEVPAETAEELTEEVPAEITGEVIKELTEEVPQEEPEEPDVTEPEDLTAEEIREREVTVGELLDLREETEEEKHERLMRELFDEMDAIEREGQERSREREERVEHYEKPEKKHGWISHLRFRRRHENQEAAEKQEEPVKAESDPEKEPTRKEGELLPEEQEKPEKVSKEPAAAEKKEKEPLPKLPEFEDPTEEEEDLEHGDINPYTGREYATNSVRMHPKRIGYVQVYNRKDHKWTDMTEWAFLGYQEQKKLLLGKDYEPPVYLD